MTLELHFQGKHPEEHGWDNSRVHFETRVDLDEWVKDIRNSGYRTFSLSDANGKVLVEGRANGNTWYNMGGIRF